MPTPATAALSTRSAAALMRTSSGPDGSTRTTSPLRSNSQSGMTPLANWPRRHAWFSSSRGCFGRPKHPRELLNHACLRGQFASGVMPLWEFERNGEVVRVDPSGPLLVRISAAADLVLSAAVAGVGIIHLFEEWLRPSLDNGSLVPLLQP